MDGQQQQEAAPVECRTCRKNGVIKQMIKFQKLGENDFLLLDAQTAERHVHKKVCINGCNTVIYWDTRDNRFHDLEGGAAHDCRNNPERYHIMAANQKEIISEQRVLPVSSQPSSTTAVAQQEQQLTDLSTTTDPARIIPLMWTMIKDMNRKLDHMEELKNNSKNLIDFMHLKMKTFEEFQAKIYEKLEPNQFQKGSSMMPQYDDSKEVRVSHEEEEEQEQQP